MYSRTNVFRLICERNDGWLFCWFVEVSICLLWSGNPEIISSTNHFFLCKVLHYKFPKGCLIPKEFLCSY